MLSYYRNRDDEGLAIRGAVSVRTARLKTSTGDKLRFEIHSHAPSSQGSQSSSIGAGQKWYMKATHPGEVARWTQMIARSIEFYQQQDRIQIPPPGSDADSVQSNREGSRKTKSLRSSVDMLRSWSGRPSHGVNHSRTSINPPKGTLEPIASHATSEAKSVYEHDDNDSQSQSSAASDSSQVPHLERLPLQLHSLQMEIDLVHQLLNELVLPAGSSPRLGEIKSALQRSILTVKDSVDQYTTMALEREAWYVGRVETEADARRMWEENVVALANQSEKVERELVRSVKINKGQRRVLRNLLGSSMSDDPTTPRAIIEVVAPLDGVESAGAATSSSPPVVPLERPDPVIQVPLPDTARSTLRSPLAAQLTGLDGDELLDQDDSDTDEFFDAIETGLISKLPSVIITQPNTPLPPSLDTEPYKGYKNLRDRLPIGSDNRPPVSLWAVLKGSIGKDLTKISFPVFFNEPTSMLQRMAEDMEFSECRESTLVLWAVRAN